MGSVISSTVGSAVSRQNTSDTNRYNYNIAKQTNASNERVAQQNLDFQKATFQYNKDLQERIFQREDTAAQRTVADMRAAGLSPLAMQGTNGAGEAIAVTAPQNNMQYQSAAPGVPADMSALSNLSNMFSEVLQFKNGLQQIERQGLENKYLSATYDNRITQSNYDTDIKGIQKRIADIDSLLKEYDRADATQKRIYDFTFGLNDGMSEKERTMAILNHILYPQHGTSHSKSDALKFETTPLSGYQNHQELFNAIGDALDKGGKSSAKVIERILEAIASF